MYELADLRDGFDETAEAVIVGSGAGGAVAALNLAEAGMAPLVLEAGPKIREADMTRDAPKFMARYFWDGGVRAIGGTAQIPSLQGRCLGGSTVVNSAIMLPLPDWVVDEWRGEQGVRMAGELEPAYDRVFTRTKTTKTPMAVMGRRNLVVKEALEKAGIGGGPLPRAVHDCEGCGDCITGCATGRKQSVDRSYLVDAEAKGARIFTCSMVDRVLVEGGRAVGVVGRVVDPRGRRTLAPFVVRAKRVIVAAGAAQTPALLLASGLTGHGHVGATFFAHIGGGVAGIMDEVTDPWVGATQGWGAFHPEIRGMKFESLWAPPSLIMVRWGDIGRRYYDQLKDVKRASLLVHVYRGKVTGRVRVSRTGAPKLSLKIPDSEAAVVMRGVKTCADALFGAGAKEIMHGIVGIPDPLTDASQTELLTSTRVRAGDLPMTANHIFGSAPIGRAVDQDGRLVGVDGLWVTDASLFPSPSAVNPQATIMALSDLITRKLGELA